MMKHFMIFLTALSLMFVLSSEGYSDLLGDFDGDGDVDGEDLRKFAQNFGTGVKCKSNTDCPNRHYCQKETGDCNGQETCRSRPDLCPFLWNPVCGCDGVTYSNTCMAAMAGTSLAALQPCPSICDDGTEWICKSLPPKCQPHEILALQNGCYICVNPATCKPWGVSGCETDDDCAPGYFCDPCGTSSCPYCEDCVPACKPKIPVIENYSDTGCLSTSSIDFSYNQYPFCDDNEQVDIFVNDQSIHLIHKNATYNCCADEIKISLTAEENLLRLNENEIVANPCRCLCCYDVEATIINLVPGIYALEFCWDDWETGKLKCITEEVEIP